MNSQTFILLVPTTPTLFETRILNVSRALSNKSLEESEMVVSAGMNTCTSDSNDEPVTISV